MKYTKKLFTGLLLTSSICLVGYVAWQYNKRLTIPRQHFQIKSKYSNFLAAQHAIHINDFDTAFSLTANIDNVDYAIVKTTKILSAFLNGNVPHEIDFLENEKNLSAQIIYESSLIKDKQWDKLYEHHKHDTTSLTAPIKIWSCVATNKRKEAFEFVKKLNAKEDWKKFISGQIYAEIGEIDKAKELFESVDVGFMNINDYMYIMSFYKHNAFDDSANKLKLEFTSLPGGMFMLNFNDIPDWSAYTGYENVIAFDLVQNISHTQIMMFSDLSILLLRFSEIIAPEFDQNINSVNYYLGQYFFTNGGNYEKYFKRIGKDSPFYLFAILRDAEKSGNIRKLERVMRSAPLFIPAANQLIAYHIQHNNKWAAIRLVNRALTDSNLTEKGRAYFLKKRAQIYYMFDELNKSQQDLYEASSIIEADDDIVALQARIWSKKKTDIENAYSYAMGLVAKNPTNILAWDVLSQVVEVREGNDAAIEILASVADISVSCSSLYERLGDLYVKQGNKTNAQDAYKRAIELSSDGLSILPILEKKLRKIR